MTRYQPDLLLRILVVPALILAGCGGGGGGDAPPNNPPTASSAAFTTDEDVVLSGTLPASDPDGGVLTYSISAAPANGVATVTGVYSGSFTYTPSADFNGADSFSFRVVDGGGLGSSATVSITVNPVNDAPRPVLDSVTTSEDTTLAGIDVLSNDSEPESEAMTVTAVAAGVGGTPALNPDSTVDFTPAQDFNGLASFTYTVADPWLASAVGTVEVTVTAVNDAPSFQNPGGVVGYEDLSRDLQGFRIVDVDAREGPGAVDVAVSVSHGTLSLASTAGITLVTGSGSGDRSMRFTGHIDQVNAVLDGLSYLGDPDFDSTDSLSGWVSDLGNTGAGGALTHTTSAFIQLFPVNDPPVLLAAAGTVTEGSSSTVGPGQLRTTDIDNLPAQITYTLENPAPAFGTLRLAGAGLAVGSSFTQADVDAGLLTYEHAGAEVAQDIFLFSVADSAGGSLPTTSFIFTVTPVNDAPVLSLPGAQTTPEATSLSISGISLSDVDAGTSAGPYQVTVSAPNGSVTVASSGTVTGNGSSYVNVSGTLAEVNSALGVFFYQPRSGFSGTDTLAFSARDGGNTGSGGEQFTSGNLLVTVTGPNDAPILLGPLTPPSVVGGGLVEVRVAASDPDAGSGTVRVSLSCPDADVQLVIPVDGLTFVGGGNGTSSMQVEGTIADVAMALSDLSFRHSLGTPGTYTVTIVVDDLGNTGTGGAQQTQLDVDVTVTAISKPTGLAKTGVSNSPPVARSDAAVVEPGGSVTLALLANDEDPDGDSLQLLSVKDPVQGWLVRQPDGSVRYDPVPGFEGLELGSYRVEDGRGGEADGSVVLTVTSFPGGLAGERVSVDSSGGESRGAVPADEPVSLSADGRHVAFVSTADDLVAGDTNGLRDVFVHDRLFGLTRRVSVSTAGMQADGPSGSPSISADGRLVAFVSGATNLVLDDTNRAVDVFVHDLDLGETHRVSLADDGAELRCQPAAACDAAAPRLSWDGRRVRFLSRAPALGGDGVPWRLHERDRQARLTVSLDPFVNGPAACRLGDCGELQDTPDWRFLVFSSARDDLVEKDGNGVADVFLHDRHTGITERISVGDGGVEADGPSRSPGVSADGRLVAFVSAAGNLVPGDANGAEDVFVHDRVTGATLRVNHTPAGEESSAGCPATSCVAAAALSGDGRYLGFGSAARDLVADDTNGAVDVFTLVNPLRP